jgi:hypothetical protein
MKKILLLLIHLGVFTFAFWTLSHQKALSFEDPIYKYGPTIEDYSSETKELKFGDKLRITQLEMQRLYARSRAIACAEGFYVKGSLAQRNNNPGNLKKSGYPRDPQRHSIFPNKVVGWLETNNLLYKHNDKPIEKIGRWWATDPNWSTNVKACHERLQES